MKNDLSETAFEHMIALFLFKTVEVQYISSINLLACSFKKFFHLYKTTTKYYRVTRVREGPSSFIIIILKL